MSTTAKNGIPGNSPMCACAWVVGGIVGAAGAVRFENVHRSKPYHWSAAAWRKISRASHSRRLSALCPAPSVCHRQSWVWAGKRMSMHVVRTAPRSSSASKTVAARTTARKPPHCPMHGRIATSYPTTKFYRWDEYDKSPTLDPFPFLTGVQTEYFTFSFTLDCLFIYIQTWFFTTCVWSKEDIMEQKIYFGHRFENKNRAAQFIFFFDNTAF